jgi:hypothetical protein
VCPKAPGGGDDGCFSSLFYGGLLDIPVTLSRRVSGHDLYFGIRYAHLVVSGATEYKASSRTFPSERVEKTVLQGLGGLFFGASLDIGDHRLIPELQIMVSPAAAGGIVWVPMAGIGIARPPER